MFIHPTLARLCFCVTLILASCHVAPAEEAALLRMDTGDQSRGWDAVGRLDMGPNSFCTGALIAPDLVLTAAHCLFDKGTGARIAIDEIEFLAGWRNGRAAAYRHVKRAVAHPDFIWSDGDRIDRVGFDLALLLLDQPIRMASITPFETDPEPLRGDVVGVVSYAQNRSEAPSLQNRCEVLDRKANLLIVSCSVDFGSSGAPIFTLHDGVARVVSVVSSKADYGGRSVALGAPLEGPLLTLKAALSAERSPFRPVRGLDAAEDGAHGGAKFVRP